MPIFVFHVKTCLTYINIFCIFFHKKFIIILGNKIELNFMYKIEFDVVIKYRRIS